MQRYQDSPRLRELLLLAAEKPDADRAAYVRGACCDDPGLGAELGSLLHALECATGFAPDPTLPRHLDTVSVELGTRVGRYTLLRLIGEGGFGSVFLAQQERPVRREVALKLIKVGMDTRQVIARFEAERQALAMMDHPGIARVLDAGATDAGRPYFVMDLVDGVRITEYCDAHRLAIRQRLELFAQVCQAVQHAHTKGVIHRDLKPSNVLVTEVDGRPVPKVIDFGIAKATRGRLTDQTLSEQRQWLGTPQYMSPEQADGGGDVDTRSDVYMLGVLLYELLTGVTPFDVAELGGLSDGDAQRFVRCTEPPKPSGRLSRLGPALAGLASQRRTEPRKLARAIRGELDWIVMRCLEKDRTRRYETADALATDVRRHLAGEPLSAGAPSALYRLRKFARRHRMGLATAAAVVLCAALVAASVVYGALRDAQHREAYILSLKEEHARTTEARGEAEAVNGFIAEMLDATSLHAFRSGGVDAPTTQAADTTVREMLDRAVRRLDQGVLKDQSKVEAEVRMTLGQTYRGLGLLPAATVQFRRALAIRQRLFGPDNLDVATSLNDLGFMLRFQGEDEEAAKVLWEALRVRREFLGDENLAVAETLDNLGSALGFVGDYRGAEKALREALRLQRALRKGDHEDMGSISDSLGVVLQYKGDLDGAEREFRESRRVWGKVLGEENALVGRALARLGMVLGWKGDLVHAEESERAALEIFRKRSLDLHPDVGNANNWLGEILQSRGDDAGAERAFRAAMRIWDITLGEGTPDRDAPRENVAFMLLARGDRSGGAQLARECADGDLGRVENALVAKADDPRLLARRAEVLARLGRFDAALRDYDNAIALDPARYECRQQRACLRLYLGQDQRYRQECREILERWGATDDPQIGEAVAKACLLTPEPVGDLRVLRRLADLRKAEPVAPWLEPGFQQTRGLADYRSGDSAGAIASLGDRRARFSYSDYSRNSAADFYLAMAHHRLGQVREAREALARGVRHSEKYMFEAGEGDLGHGGLVNWLACRIARREAEALLAK